MSVNLTTSLASITIDPTEISVDEILSMLDSIGFEGKYLETKQLQLTTVKSNRVTLAIEVSPVARKFTPI